MGKIETFVKKHEKEKHLDTETLIGIMQWYIQEMAKLNREATEARNSLTDAYNARLEELKAQMEAQK